jgi:hypothetical protein
VTYHHDTCALWQKQETLVAETVEQSSCLRPLQQCAWRVIVFSIFRPSEGQK